MTSGVLRLHAFLPSGMHLPRKAFIQPQDLFFQQRDG
jgi:hypothetical protein